MIRDWTLDARGEAALKVRHEREVLGLTQQQLGTKAGVSRMTVMRMENGQRVPIVRTLSRVLTALAVAQRERESNG